MAILCRSSGESVKDSRKQNDYRRRLEALSLSAKVDGRWPPAVSLLAVPLGLPFGGRISNKWLAGRETLTTYKLLLILY